jgi:hypothetical protein
MSDETQDTRSQAADEASQAADEASQAAARPSQADGKASQADDKPRSAVLPEPELPGAGTPEGQTLRRALALYHLGNYAEMRALLTPLTSAKDPKIADAASGLLRRIAVDPVQIGFLLGCLAAIVAIAMHYLG